MEDDEEEGTGNEEGRDEGTGVREKVVNEDVLVLDDDDDDDDDDEAA